MIRINKIEFYNYRQYKNVTIKFDKNSDYNLFILKAKNGTGKTTFLNGILWCLYAHEHYISDASKALKVVNESAIQEKNEDDVVDVCVKLTITDENMIYIFDRTQKFKVCVDPFSGLKKPIETGDPVLVIKQLPMNNALANARIFEETEETDRIVKQFFDEDIYSYYFFDGENLKNYFDSANAGKVKDSIKSLSQVNLLENAINRSDILSSEKRRELGRITGIDLTLYDKVDALKDEIRRYTSDIEQYSLDIPVLQRRFDDLNDKMAGYRPIRDNQLKRNELEDRLKNREAEYSEFKSTKKAFIREYYMLFNLFPKIKATLDMIISKENKGELPPRIDKKMVDELLSSHVENCPVCDGEIGEHAREHLKKLLNDLDVSNQTSNYLSKIKGSLEEAIDKCKKYPEIRDGIIKKERLITNEIDEINKELQEISQYLTKYSNDSSSIMNVSELEKERQDVQNEILSKNRIKTENELLLRQKKDQLEILEKELKEMENSNEQKILLQKQVATFKSLTTHFTQVKKDLMDVIKNEIEDRTWELFSNMLWKKETFNSLKINDDYEMSVYNNNINDMTGSLGATESMALAYAFTLAIHETSGQNCPLVVDSPLGRVSDENRENMARELLNISKNKQIIMLFTPDEYSAEVKNIYGKTTISIRDLTLTQDEQEINEVD